MEYTFEPKSIEIHLMKIERLFLKSYYRHYLNSLDIKTTYKVLDYCSGSGLMAKLLAPKLTSGTIDVADISTKWLNEAKKSLKKFNNFSCNRIEDFSKQINGGNYDVITVHYAIHDFPKDLQQNVLAHLLLNLKDTGTLYLREPLNENHGFTIDSIKKLLDQIQDIDCTIKTAKSKITGQYIDVVCRKKVKG